MGKPKKIINDPNFAVPELLEGLVFASHGQLQLVHGATAVCRSAISRDKVALLIGGGSGHEPLFPGLVGEGLADGAACGHIFAAPSPDVILAATRAINQGQGVLYLYGNYSGDNMNFDLAAEMAADEGILVKTIRVWDDVASAPPERFEDRRGIAGDLFVIKVAGAAATRLKDLSEIVRVTTKARDNIRTIGVALNAGSNPDTGEATFELNDDEIEIGMGLHGEPGVHRGAMRPADSLVEAMLDPILKDLPFRSGDEVALLVNDLGSTTWMELLIVTRKAHQILRERGITVYDTVVGRYCTCQEMAGCSLTLLKLDEELKQFYDAPARSLAFSKG